MYFNAVCWKICIAPLCFDLLLISLVTKLTVPTHSCNMTNFSFWWIHNLCQHNLLCMGLDLSVEHYLPFFCFDKLERSYKDYLNLCWLTWTPLDDNNQSSFFYHRLFYSIDKPKLNTMMFTLIMTLSLSGIVQRRLDMHTWAHTFTRTV